MQEKYDLFISLKEIRKRVRPLIGETPDNIEKLGIVEDLTTQKTKTKTLKKKQVDKAKEATLEIARNLKAMNMPLEQIQLATKLSLKEIEEL
jgi:predicted transposase YdaD